MSPRATLIGLLVVFVAALAPFAGTFFEHYPDERNYTNAAITMVRTGEWVTPRWPDGHPNVHKPIIAYWVVAASYALFGVTLAGARLPFMLAGALVVALTYVLARRLTGSRDTAILAALITASAPQLILSSMRAIPDILLCLFLLASAYGFLNLTVLDRRTAGSYWAAYLGAGLAIQTKGLLALVFVVYAWLFAWRTRRDGAPALPLRSLLHAPSMLGAAMIAAWWYVAMYQLHGPGPSQVFVGDQITWNLAIRDGSSLHRIPTYLAFLLINLMPWSLLLVPLALRDPGVLVAGHAREHRAQRFIVLWGVLMAIIFGLGQKMEPRYILPAVPLFAILLASAFARADAALMATIYRYLLHGMLAVFAVFGIVLCLLDWSAIGAGAALVALALFAAVIAAILLLTRLGGPAIGIALAVLLAFPLTVIALGPALRPDDGVAAMARELERPRRDPTNPVLVAGPEFLANKLRVLTGGRVAIDSWSRLGAAPDTWPSVMILPASQAATLDLTRYRTRDVATEVRSVPVMGVLQAMLARRVPEFLDSRRDRYVLAIRR